MKVRQAKTAGFCMGVRRAMELAISSAHGDPGGIASYGPLIHNPQVLELLASKGVEVLEAIPRLGSQNGGTVIIRAHGVPPESKRALKKAGFAKVIDGTCPRVVRVQAIIRRATKHGGHAVIVGDRQHPEVIGLLGHARGRGHVISRPGEVPELPPMDQVVVVAQTTQREEIFAQVVAALKERFGEVGVHDTICAATHRRQNEVRRLAGEVDGIVVVGGRQSGNTKRLAQLAREEGCPAFFVETEAELNPAELAKLGSVAVTAGASTPNWMIRRVTRVLAALRSEKEPGWTFWARRVFRFLVRSQILVAAGAASMTVGAILLQGLKPNLTLALTAFTYIYAMHIINQFLDREAGQYNDPDRAHFLNKHRAFLISTGVLSAAAGLALCATMGALPFIIVTVMSVMGLLYSVSVVPRRLEDKIRIQRLKDIPGSKSLSAALAWAVMVAILPALTLGVESLGPTVVAFCFTLAMVLARCALFDILDVQGDLIVGKETIPIALGEKNTMKLFWRSLGLLGLALLAAPLAGITSTLAWALLWPLAGLALMALVLAKDWVLSGSLSEGLVDLNFVLAGIMAIIWPEAWL